MNGRWSHFRHGADIGVEGSGATLDEAFANAAVALTAVIADPTLVRSSAAIELKCEAPDAESLLIEWLNSVVYEMATRRMLFARFDVHIDGDRLRAYAWGESIDRERHQPAAEVKGATYTELSVRRDAQGAWRARCVVDV